ncbi:MAG: hypothetical protein EOP06_32195 [Proteobacteria bacterium]|nr:MAG: hypothetical protein EOP06_32195 [Pseudomonadota bacterium]
MATTILGNNPNSSTAMRTERSANFAMYWAIAIALVIAMVVFYSMRTSTDGAVSTSGGTMSETTTTTAPANTNGTTGQ